MPINIVMLSPHVSVNPVEAQAASNPEWGLAAGFSSQTLLFTGLTPLATCISSNKQPALTAQSDFPVLLTAHQTPATRAQVTFHVTLFPQRDSFMTPF